MWHSDVTWRAEPSLGSVLRARIIPDVGGDTLFADMVAAYEGLSPAMKDWVCGLTAVHDGSGFASYLGIPASSGTSGFRCRSNHCRDRCNGAV